MSGTRYGMRGRKPNLIAGGSGRIGRALVNPVPCMRYAVMFLLLIAAAADAKVQFGVKIGMDNTTNSLAADAGMQFSVKDAVIDLGLSGNYGVLMLSDKYDTTHGALADLDYRILERLELYILAGYRYRMNVYALETGAGAKFIYWKDAALDASVSLMPMYARDMPVLGAARDTLRLSFRHKLVWKIDEKRSTLASILFYKPSAVLLSDFIIEAKHVLTVQVNEVFGISVANDLYYKAGDFSSKLAVGCAVTFGE